MNKKMEKQLSDRQKSLGMPLKNLDPDRKRVCIVGDDQKLRSKLFNLLTTGSANVQTNGHDAHAAKVKNELLETIEDQPAGTHPTLLEIVDTGKRLVHSCPKGADVLIVVFALDDTQFVQAAATYFAANEDVPSTLVVGMRQQQQTASDVAKQMSLLETVANTFDCFALQLHAEHDHRKVLGTKLREILERDAYLDDDD